MIAVEAKSESRLGTQIINATTTVGYLIHVQELSQSLVWSWYNPEIDGRAAPRLLRKRPPKGSACREDGAKIGVDSGDASAGQR